MSTSENSPYLSGEALAGLGITTGDVIESIETLVRGSALDTATHPVSLPGDDLSAVAGGFTLTGGAAGFSLASLRHGSS